MEKRKPIILVDLDVSYCRIIARYKSIFEYKNGIFSPLERIKKQWEDTDIFYFHPEIKLEKIYSKKNGWIPFSENYSEISDDLKNKKDDQEKINYLKQIFEDSYIIDSKNLNLLNILDEVLKNIENDLQFLKREDFLDNHSNVNIYGKTSDIWIHPSVEITPGVVFNSKNGPIIIDKNCKISAFTYIEGPFYASKDCYIDNVRIAGGVILGRGCRVSGEIENSILGNFTNKHHEGFLGHSIVGDWVNLGALTTTSDLKNNYGEVRLFIPESRIPDFADTPIIINTNRIKFGSIIGDCVKTAIGTMLNTGTVIDIGSNIFGGSPPPYVPPFSWGIRGHKYQFDRFLKDCEKIFARRKQTINPSFIELTKFYYYKTI